MVFENLLHKSTVPLGFGINTSLVVRLVAALDAVKALQEIRCTFKDLRQANLYWSPLTSDSWLRGCAGHAPLKVACQRLLRLLEAR